jgi:hypothetical protein
LQFLSDEKFNAEIADIWANEKFKLDGLVSKLIARMTSHQNFEVDKQLEESFVQSQSTGQILYLDSAFKGFRYQLSKIKFRNMKVDNDFFGKESEIDKLYRRAVGCRATCLFCKRKCQEAEDC